MNRTTRTILVVCIALATAAAATFVVYRAVQLMPARTVEVVGAKVVVASKELPAGTLLTAEHLRVVNFPADSVPPASFSTIENVVGRGLKVALGMSDPVTDPKLAAAGTGAGLPPTIPPGMRGVSVRVDDVVSVAGFAVPGTRVDVLATTRQRGDREPEARTILSNVLVLMAGTKADQERAKDVKAAPVVTLALLPADVEKIQLAAAEGKITLSLRNPLDEGPTETTGIGMSALMRGAEPPAPPPVPKPARKPAAKAVDPTPQPLPVAQPPERRTVEVIRAAKLTTQELP